MTFTFVLCMLCLAGGYAIGHFQFSSTIKRVEGELAKIRGDAGTEVRELAARTDSCIAANRPAEEREQFEAAKAFILIQIAAMPAKHAIKLESFGSMSVVSPLDDPTKREVLES